MKRILFLAVIIIFISAVGIAQVQKNHARWFKLAGKVIDKSGSPVQWGRVCLKETHGHILKMKPIGNDGHFNLSWLDARFNYEIYAEQGNVVSENVFIDGSSQAETVLIDLKLKINQSRK